MSKLEQNMFKDVHDCNKNSKVNLVKNHEKCKPKTLKNGLQNGHLLYPGHPSGACESQEINFALTLLEMGATKYHLEIPFERHGPPKMNKILLRALYVPAHFRPDSARHNFHAHRHPNSHPPNLTWTPFTKIINFFLQALYNQARFGPDRARHHFDTTRHPNSHPPDNHWLTIPKIINFLLQALYNPVHFGLDRARHHFDTTRHPNSLLQTITGHPFQKLLIS